MRRRAAPSIIRSIQRLPVARRDMLTRRVNEVYQETLRLLGGIRLEQQAANGKWEAVTDVASVPQWQLLIVLHDHPTNHQAA